MPTLGFGVLRLAMVLLPIAPGLAQASVRHVEIVNQTGLVMIHFYASNSSSSQWGPDMLGQGALQDGASAGIDIDDGTTDCKFDFKAEFTGKLSLIRNGIDTCTIGSFTYRQ